MKGSKSFESVYCGLYFEKLLNHPSGQQQDAHEFLLKLIEQCDNEALALKSFKKKMKRKQESSSNNNNDWNETSKGKVLKVTTLGLGESFIAPMINCFGCMLTTKKKTNKTLEPSVGISVNLSGNFQDQIAPLKFSRMPLVLIVHLIRDSNKDGKIFFKNVDFKSIYKNVMTVNGQNYMLHGIVYHAGQYLHSGHYVARVRNDNEWTQFDDTSIKSFKRVNDDIGNLMPYLLFYSQIDK